MDSKQYNNLVKSQPIETEFIWSIVLNLYNRERMKLSNEINDSMYQDDEIGSEDDSGDEGRMPADNSELTCWFFLL